jgi:hypothetical protein
MNTLPRAVTARFFPSAKSYDSLRQHWRDLMNSSQKDELSAAHHLLYLVLLGKDWRKSFTPPTNPRKLANGAFYGWKLFHAWEQLHLQGHENWLLAPFAGLVTTEMLAGARKLLLPGINRYSLKPFVGRAYPFEAYQLPTVMAKAPLEQEQPHA